jgi:hypothetical protein
MALDWHPIFNAAPGQAEKLLRIRKDWTANSPSQPDNQGANPMLPNDDCTYRIQGANPMLPNDDCTYRIGGELVLDC